MALLWLEEVLQARTKDSRTFRCGACLETYTTSNMIDPYPEDVLVRFHAPHDCAMQPQPRSGPQALYWAVGCKRCPYNAAIYLKQIETRQELGRAYIPEKFTAYCDLCREEKVYEKNDVRLIKAQMAFAPFEPGLA